MPELAICGSCGSMHKDRSSSTCASCTRPRRRPFSRQRNESNSFYASARWRKVRAIVLDRDGYQCVKCGKASGKASDLTVHHRTALTVDPNLALEPDNLVTICRRCHSRLEAHKRADATASGTTSSPVSFTQRTSTTTNKPSTALTRDTRHTGGNVCIRVKNARPVDKVSRPSFDEAL